MRLGLFTGRSLGALLTAVTLLALVVGPAGVVRLIDCTKGAMVSRV